MKHHFTAIAFVSLLVFACAEREKTTRNLKAIETNSDTVHVITDSVSGDPTNVAKDSIRRVIFQKGDRMGNYSLTGYYDNYLYPAVMQFNDIGDERDIKAGTVILVPTLRQALYDERFRLIAVIPIEVDSLIAARDAFERISRQLFNLHAQNESDTLDLPATIDSTLIRIITNLTWVRSSIASKGSLQPPPNAIISTLDNTIALLKPIQAGKNDGYGYDIAALQIAFCAIITSAMDWGKARASR